MKEYIAPILAVLGIILLFLLMLLIPKFLGWVYDVPCSTFDWNPKECKVIKS